MSLNKEKKIKFLKGELNPHPLWPDLVWPESNEKCQVLCQLSCWGTCIILLESHFSFKYRSMLHDPILIQVSLT